MRVSTPNRVISPFTLSFLLAAFSSSAGGSFLCSWLHFSSQQLFFSHLGNLLFLLVLEFFFALSAMSTYPKSVDEHARDDVVDLVGFSSSKERPTIAGTPPPSDSTSRYEVVEEKRDEEGEEINQEERDKKREKDRLITRGIAGYMVYQPRFGELDVLNLRDRAGISPGFNIQLHSTKERPDNLPGDHLLRGSIASWATLS